MENISNTYLVFGATGRTGRRFTSIALSQGHQVIALVRNPQNSQLTHANLKFVQGTVTEYPDIDALLSGVDFVVCMLGDAAMQKTRNVNAEFVSKLIPAMRRKNVKRFLYQAGAFSRPYKKNLPFMLWLLKHTLVRFSGLLGQHRDNEAVINYLAEYAGDIDWTVHRASIISDDLSKGILVRSESKNSLATFTDCAAYNYRLLSDDAAIHTCDLSFYSKT